MSRPIFSDIESPAMKSQEIDNLKTNSKRTGICTAVAFVFGFIGFCMAAAAVAGVRQLMIDSQVKTGAILTVGNASPLKGHSKAHSLYAGSGQWTSKTVLPENLSDYQAVSHKTHVYVIGGQKGCNSSDTCAGTVVNTVYQYDTKLDKYTTKAAITDNSVAAIRYRYASAVVGDKIYIIGGLTADTATGMLKTTLIYDISANSWSDRARTWPPVAPTPARPSSAARSTSSPATSPSTRSTFSTPSRFSTPPLRPPRGRLLRVSPPSAATSPAPPPAARLTPSADTTTPPARGTPGAFHDTMFEFTPGAAAWVEKAKMPSSRGDKAAVTMSDGSIIVVGGETHAREEQNQVAAHPVEQYYPAHDTWVPKASIPTARFRFGAAQVDDIVYAMGGHRVCETNWDTYASDCARKTLDSVEALLDVAHPDIWVHV